MTTEREQDDECPACDTTIPGEWDPILHRFACATCSALWRRRPGRLVPDAAPRLPGTVPELELTTELPDAGLYPRPARTTRKRTWRGNA